MKKQDLERIRDKIIKIILEDPFIEDEMDRVELMLNINTFLNNYERDINILRKENRIWK